MREIKFRAWDHDRMNGPVGILLTGTPAWLEMLSSGAEIMLYTGLKDKNGVEIYEGDILEFDSDEWGSITGNKWAVEWNDYDGAWDTGGGTNSECKEFKKIIGNIYENPELLEST